MARPTEACGSGWLLVRHPLRVARVGNGRTTVLAGFLGVHGDRADQPFRLAQGKPKLGSQPGSPAANTSAVRHGTFAPPLARP
jgi:hypothetical protein